MLKSTPFISRSFQRFSRSYTSKPPSYFSEYINNSSSSSSPTPPKSLFQPLESSNSISHQTHPTNQLHQQQSSSKQSGSSRLTSIRDFSIVVSIFTLSYFAVDNYRTRLILEQKIMDSQINHMKAIAIAQNNYNNHRKKREIQVLNERRKTQKREMKMVYHISMLRKQLIDAGLKPVEIDEAIAEFEKNVKMETSISNVSGTALWVVDDSRMYQQSFNC